MLQLGKKEFMTVEEIKSKSPSIFTESGFSNLSERYVHIPTSLVIDDMEKLGWSVVDVKEVKARKKVGYQKHLVVFRNPDLTIEGKDGDIVHPQILITNSHDGSSSFMFQSGLFRMVCENGLVISTQDFDKMRIRHMNYTFDELREKINEMVEQLPLTIESMNKMKSKTLTIDQMNSLAQRSLAARFTEEELKDIDVDINALLTPERKEDESNDLFTVFNRIQEKMINGGISYMKGTKVRKMRKIKNFQQDIKINSKLYEIAYDFI